MRVADAGAPRGPRRRGFDRVLVDPPCSGLGTLQSRPDLRWRVSPERIAELAGCRRGSWRAAPLPPRRGGTLVYSVCTISPRREPDDVVERFLAAHPEFDRRAARYARATLRPDRSTDTDGFFIARLRAGRCTGR